MIKRATKRYTINLLSPEEVKSHFRFQRLNAADNSRQFAPLKEKTKMYPKCKAFKIQALLGFKPMTLSQDIFQPIKYQRKELKKFWL